MFGAFILLCLALRHPFTDVIMYTAPLFVAAVAWLSATVIDVSCSTEACQVISFITELVIDASK